MLHIIFILLKIIGIILASILGLLVFLLLIILFIPIRYRINANNKDTIFAEVKVSWLLRIIYLRVSYINDDFNIILRIFGKVFYDFKNQKKGKKSKKKKVRIKTEKEVKKTEVKKVTETNGTTENKAAESKVTESKVTESKVTQNKVTENKVIETKVTNTKVIKENVNEIRSTTDYKTVIEKQIPADCENNVQAVKNERVKTEVFDKENENNDINITPSNLHMEKDSKTSRVTEKIEDSLDDKNVLRDNLSENKSLTKENKEKKSDKKSQKSGFTHKLHAFIKKVKVLFQKIKNISLKFIEKLKGFYPKLKVKLNNLETTFINIKDKISSLLDKWHKLKAFLGKETNQKGIKKAWLSIKLIIKHLLPTKCKARIEFGTGDPYSTGQVLTYLAPFYGIYGNSAIIIPNFDEELFEGSVSCIGRIRLFTLLIICLKLILDKNFRQLMKNYKVFKEDF